MATRIAIIGFGFSGLMVTANLAKTAPAGTVMYLIDPELTGQGLAYSTTRPEHLLNVPAARMSAFEGEADHLLHWLKTAVAAKAKAALGLTVEYGPADFIPRALYAAYLSSIWQDTQHEAARRAVLLKLVQTRAVYVRSDEAGLAVLTERRDAIATDRILLATGNEIKPIAAGAAQSPHLIQQPWVKGALAGAAQWAEPVMLIGAGLTAVDTVLSLRAEGYKGKILAVSRGGHWPHAYAPAAAACMLPEQILYAQQPLSRLLRYLRQTIASHGEWRPVIDALRPYTAGLWNRLSLREQQRLIKRGMSLWNIHRHRMAPQIAATIEAETAKGSLALVASKHTIFSSENDGLRATLDTHEGEQIIHPSRVINCTGGELNLARSANPLLKQAVAEGVVECHANGLGIAVDQRYRAWGQAYPNLYAIGSLMTGEWLESTAVPELRAQAQRIARALVND